MAFPLQLQTLHLFYLSQVSGKKSGAKPPQKISSKSTLRLSLATPPSQSSMSHDSSTVASAVSAANALAACAVKDEEDPRVRLSEGETLLLASGGPGDMEADERNGITDVIGQRPSARLLREMNTPVVPEGVLKERPKVMGGVRMKNVSSPNKSELS